MKKVVVASYLAEEIVDPLFAFPGQHGGVEALVGVYAYAIQIYADFSGYTDMAIGLALLLGFRFPQNFDAPYTAVSLQDFWRRWHMTLSRWLRDYLYIPLGGNQRWPPPHLPQPDAHDGARRALARRGVDVRHLGRCSTAAGLAFERWLERAPGRQPADRRLAEPVAVGRRRRHLPTSVCLGWVASSWAARAVGRDAFDVLGRIFGGTASVRLEPDGRRRRRRHAGQPVRPGRDRARGSGPASAGGPLPAQAVALAGVLVLVDVLGPQGVAPFIYFQF